jgi:transposase-like protein
MMVSTASLMVGVAASGAEALLHSVYDQPDADSVVAQHDRIIDVLADKLPKVAQKLEDGTTR